MKKHSNKAQLMVTVSKNAGTGKLKKLVGTTCVKKGLLTDKKLQVEINRKKPYGSLYTGPCGGPVGGPVGILSKGPCGGKKCINIKNQKNYGK